MPSRAVPLVTISLARGHLRQTRLADNVERPTSRTPRTHPTEGDHPPPYDVVPPIHTENNNEVATVSPNNEDIAQAVLHLSRTLVSTPKAHPRRPTSFMFMVIYSWTQTQQTALRLYHVLSKPSSLLRSIRGQDDQALVPQHRKQRKGIHQQADEEDWDDLNGATEMVPVSMTNVRKTASMEESLPEHPEDPDMHELSSDDDSTAPRKPKRHIGGYRNPFGPGVSSDDEVEDDELWFGREDRWLENGRTKSNSVRLKSQTNDRGIPDFSTPSLMDPQQSEGGDNWSAEPSSSSLLSFSNTSTGTTSDQPLARLSRSRIPAAE
ncbi:hypothetical protein B0O80DRAFT_435322 [Mortierella sp. GBAus27b]|nr:hypothetical protein BGX31_005643 [Mortierella sp. GBA43]KAI8362220.1 hypothetical protein B0O80DRAFT_435322 [Mortierella sp. GBAus27b]